MNDTKEAIFLRIPPELKEELSHIAAKKGMTMTGIITSNLWRYVEKEHERETGRNEE